MGQAEPTTFNPKNQSQCVNTITRDEPAWQTKKSRVLWGLKPYSPGRRRVLGCRMTLNAKHEWLHVDRFHIQADMHRSTSGLLLKCLLVFLCKLNS